MLTARSSERKRGRRRRRRTRRVSGGREGRRDTSVAAAAAVRKPRSPARLSVVGVVVFIIVHYWICVLSIAHRIFPSRSALPQPIQHNSSSSFRCCSAAAVKGPISFFLRAEGCRSLRGFENSVEVVERSEEGRKEGRKDGRAAVVAPFLSALLHFPSLSSRQQWRGRWVGG